MCRGLGKDWRVIVMIVENQRQTQLCRSYTIHVIVKVADLYFWREGNSGFVAFGYFADDELYLGDGT